MEDKDNNNNTSNELKICVSNPENIVDCKVSIESNSMKGKITGIKIAIESDSMRAMTEGVSMPSYPLGYMKSSELRKALVIIAIVSPFIGFIALGFMNLTIYIPELWTNGASVDSDNNYFSCPNKCTLLQQKTNKCPVCPKYEHCNFYEGKLIWAAITTCTGFLVGFIRYFVNYPNDLQTLLEDIHMYHVDPIWAPYTFLLSCISLSGGAAMGPEQALVS